jgi:hypothetical protein
MSLILLLSGNLKEGWEKYEWRWKTKDFIPYHRNFSKPLWDGSNIKGRTILLHVEQGLGDTIQFIRYASLVAQKGAKVIVDCQSELVSILKSVEGVNQVIISGKRLPEFDVHCPLLSLPFIFNTTLETISAEVPYITIDSLLVQKWKEKVQSDDSKFKIGLAWAGNPKNKRDHYRSFPLDIFLPLAQLDKIIYYSLQKGSPAHQYTPEGLNFVNLAQEIRC